MLIVAPQPFFSPRGTPYSVYYRTLVAAELGVEADLLTYGEGEDVDIPGVRIVRIPRLPFLGPVKIGPSPAKLVLDLVLAARTVGLLLRRRYDVVHAHEEAVFFCRPLKPLFRFKLIYDMHSSLPQQLTNFRFTTSDLLIGAFKRLEARSIRGADAVITICPDLADHALGLIDDPARHFLIENSVLDPVRLAAKPANGIHAPAAEPTGDAPPLIVEGRRVIVYAGTLESYQGIELLLRAFVEVRRRVPGAFLLVVGGSAEQVRAYGALAAGLGLAEGEYLFTGRVSQQRARACIRLAAVQVSPRLTGTNTPLKVYEQLASGIPLVATDIRSHTQVLDDGIAFLAPPEPAGFADALVRALTDGAEAGRRAEAAARRYRERYAREAYVDKMRRLLEAVTRDGRQRRQRGAGRRAAAEL
jgi:glycosyltransferase involved in cell wall biosynthesis